MYFQHKSNLCTVVIIVAKFQLAATCPQMSTGDIENNDDRPTNLRNSIIDDELNNDHSLSRRVTLLVNDERINIYKRTTQFNQPVNIDSARISDAP